MRHRVVVLGLAAVAVTGCGGGAPHTARDTVARLGAFPIASLRPSQRAQPPVVATPRRLGLVVMGDTVEAELPGGIDAVVTASGPNFPHLTGSVQASGLGIATVRITAVRGGLTVRARDFDAVDNNRRLVRLRASVASVRVPPGATRTLTLSGTYVNGTAALAWEPTGTPLAVWDFNAEFD